MRDRAESEAIRRADDAVIFLDVMGTLNGRADRAEGGDEAVVPGKCAVVNDIVRVTGARIVVSSSSRNASGCRDRLLAGGLVDAFHEDWRTGSADSAGPANPRRRRGSEIDGWLRRHPEVSRYVILDDDLDGILDGQMRRLVQCRFDTGLTPTCASVAIAILERRSTRSAPDA